MQDKRARREELLKAHNKTAFGSGERLQGEFFLKMLHEVDELDREWTEAWLTWIYDFMYNRGVLDDRTRILVIVGECVVGDHMDQLPNHMRSALMAGASPKEVLEVILQACIYAGMPNTLRAVRLYRSLMQDLGVLALRDSPFRGDARDSREASHGEEVRRADRGT